MYITCYNDNQESKVKRRKVLAKIPSLWTDDDIPSQFLVFEQINKISIPVDKDSSELDFFFSIFFDTEIIKKIKTETNQYAGTIANMKCQDKLKKGSLWSKWVAVKLHMMYFFLSNHSSHVYFVKNLRYLTVGRQIIFSKVPLHLHF